MYTPYQSAYFAHWLSLVGAAEDSLTQTIASAKVDMNPHQVDAALFALRSPLSNGAILADEVGLGKTIEASLVLAQKWAEHKRFLLLIVPATLRKQWAQELEYKFDLSTQILEAKSFNTAIKNDALNPFNVGEAFGKAAIVITSYEFAARKENEIGLIPWDLVVFDEAHKLRNIYKSDGAKTARKLNRALCGRPKILLTATPLQNTLQELYGLVSFIDPHFFGSLDSFKTRYSGKRLEESELAPLRMRLARIATRTLRRQVQEEGGVKFTRRYSMTEDFRPTNQELSLYQEVSNYLQRDDLLAIKSGARHLVTLVIRKILASSTYALQGTLDTMINRLEQKLSIDEAMQDYDAIDDLTDVNELEDEDFIDPEALQSEIDELKDFQKLASTITRNAKAEALLRVLGKAFDFTERLGGSRKAVVFTESVRTQSWLAELLSENGYRDELVLLNGSNNDSSSREIYHTWMEKHQGTSQLSGSRSADMKAALVDKFREDATIMICTEAGAEGINLQFCSLLINYDLPWNPQRVEQRIGRIHRYGQKHDVVVVNFINKGNRADERVFELLSRKFRLFEGVFGASDEILGSIESGVDIERRIHEIYQKCRTNEEIEQEFNELQESIKEEIERQVADTRRSLLENFDVDVVKRLNMRREHTVQQLNEYQQKLLLLAKAELPDAKFEDQRFLHDERWYDINWQRAEETDANFFRPHQGLGYQLIQNAKDRLTNHFANKLSRLELDYGQLEDFHFSDVQNHIGQSGELIVEKLSLKTAKRTVEHLVVAACTDQKDYLPPTTAERLLQVPARLVNAESSAEFDLQHRALLQQRLAELTDQYQQGAEITNEKYFEEETEKLERWSEDRRVALDIHIKQLDQEINQARKASRQLPTLREKMEAKKALKKLERERDQVMLNYHEEKKKIEAEEDRLLTEIEGSLQIEPQCQRLFAIRWSLVRS